MLLPLVALVVLVRRALGSEGLVDGRLVTVVRSDVGHGVAVVESWVLRGIVVRWQWRRVWMRDGHRRRQSIERRRLSRVALGFWAGEDVNDCLKPSGHSDLMQST